MNSWKVAKSANEFMTQRIDMDGDCWEYIGSLTKTGYGQCYGSIAHTELGEALAHRASHKLWIGPIPEGMFVCHTCDNRKCCRPSHLFLGTHEDNMADKRLKGRGAGGNKGAVDQETVIQLVNYVPSARWASFFGVDQSAIRQTFLRHGMRNRLHPYIPVPLEEVA